MSRLGFMQKSYKYLAICAIIKNEGRYLSEWIEFHKLVGVERFYLYENRSTDNTSEILAPYVKSGDVVLINWPTHPGQLPAYDHCLANYSHLNKWIAFIDADEFLFGTYEDDLRKILKEFEAYCGVMVFWLVFGDSGHQKAPKGLVIENFTFRAPIDFPHNRLKTIVNTALAIKALNPHAFLYKKELIPVDEMKNLIDISKENFYGAKADVARVDRLRINHYRKKSAEEGIQKRMRGRADKLQYMQAGFLEIYNRNDELDLTIQRFLPLLKEKVKPSNAVFHKIFLSPELPIDFNWSWYVNNNPDLIKNGINTQKKAEQHWKDHGSWEGRKYKPDSSFRQKKLL